MDSSLSSSLSSSTPDPTPKDLYSFLQEASEGNYTLSYRYDNKDYSDIYTKDYVYYGTEGGGVLSLPSYLEEEENLLYEYSLDSEEKVVLGGCVYSVDENGNYIPSTSIVDYEYLSLIKDPSMGVTEKDIEEGEDGTLSSTDIYLCAILGGALGYGQAASYGVFDSVTFTSEEEGTWTFSLSLIDEYKDAIPQEELVGTITDVGTSSLESLESYRKDVSLPKDELTAEIASTVFSDSVHAKSTIYSVSGENKSLAATMDYSFDPTHMHTTLSTSQGIDENLYVKADKEGESIAIGDATLQKIDGENNVIGLPTQRQWSDYDFPKEFETDILKATRKIDESTYHYYGYQADDFVSSLMRTFFVDSPMNVASLDFKVQDGKVHQILASFVETPNSDATAYFHYEVVIDILPFEPIQELESYAPIDNVTDKIEASFAFLTGENVSYKVDAYSVEDKKANPESYDGQKVIVTPDVVLIQEKDVLHTAVTGYKKVDGGVLPFQVTAQNGEEIVRPLGEKLPGSLSSYIPFKASPNVFDIDDEGNYVLRPNVVYINRAIFSGPFGRVILPETLKMKTDEEGRITTITYDAEAVSTIKEQVDITDYGTATIPEALQEKIDTLEGFVVPTTWGEESSDIAAKLTSFLGADAQSVPYVYVPDVYGKLVAIENEDNVHISSNDIQDYGKTAFVTAYANKLLEEGYVVDSEAIAPNSGTVYVKGNVAIEVCKDDYNGIYVTRNTQN